MCDLGETGSVAGCALKVRHSRVEPAVAAMTRTASNEGDAPGQSGSSGDRARYPGRSTPDIELTLQQRIDVVLTEQRRVAR